jgi:hypothetical protein
MSSLDDVGDQATQRVRHERTNHDRAPGHEY